jgi:hypothetical protein
MEEDVFQTSSKEDQALETEAKARVHTRAVLAQVRVPLVLLPVQTHLSCVCSENTFYII